MSFNETIAAISTPVGEGGIGIVRLSGHNAVELAEKIFLSPSRKNLSGIKSHSLTYGFIVNPETGVKIDEALFTVMKAPNTYTREDVVEINCHGGSLPLRETLTLLIRNGARLAEPGEFTKRAFLNGRIDLSQAEAVIDIIRAKTTKAEMLAMQQLEGNLSRRINELIGKVIGLCVNIEAYIDFPEEDIETLKRDEMLIALKTLIHELKKLAQSYEEGRFFREGVSTAIVGKPNVGKSSLLNVLLEKDRAIVTEAPGTTRDVIVDYLNINGLPLRIMDTAGIRESHDIAEQEGVKRSLKAIEDADIVLAVFDSSRTVDELDREIAGRLLNKKALFIINKIDIESPSFRIKDLKLPEERCLKVSALHGYGIDNLKSRIVSLCAAAGEKDDAECMLISNIRHRDLIEKTISSLTEAEELLHKDEPPEIIALFLRESAGSLGEITGISTAEDVLDRIFSEFCIGK